MDKHRAVSWALGIIVCLVLIIIIKSCMGEPDTSGLKKRTKTSVADTSTTGISIFTGATTTAPPVFDIFGKPVESSIYTGNKIQTLSEDTTTTVAETDVFGNIVTQTEYVETDIFGNIISETTSESTSTETSESESENVSTEVSTLSPLEQYESDLNNPNNIGGFNHNKYDDEGNPIATLPPDFAIIIN